MSIYVLVHGGWAGGWQFKAIENHLRQAKHTVYRPTLTGLGERVHLASPAIDLDTHITDILNLFKYEELDDVILMGYSYSGVIITAVADKIPQHIRRLVYLDGFVPSDGQSLADLLGDDVIQFMQQAANAYGDGWRIPHDPPDAHLRTDQPLKSATQAISLSNNQAKMLPRTFIHCTEDYELMDPVLTPIIEKARHAISNPDWTYYEIAAAHGSVWETHPEELSNILLGLS